LLHKDKIQLPSLGYIFHFAGCVKALTEAPHRACQLITALDHTAWRLAKHWCHWLVQHPSNVILHGYDKLKNVLEWKLHTRKASHFVTLKPLPTKPCRR